MHTLIEFAASFDAKQTEITMKFQVFVLHGNIHITHIPTSVVANDEYRQFYILFLYYNVPCKIEYYAISSYYKHYGQNHKTLYTFFIPILHSWNSITRAKKWKRTEKKQNDNINNEKLIWANVKTVCVNWKRIFCFFFVCGGGGGDDDDDGRKFNQQMKIDNYENFAIWKFCDLIAMEY